MNFDNHEPISARTEGADTASITILTAKVPNTVSKTYKLTANGKVTKKTVADISRGRLQVKHINDLSDFADVLKNLKHDNALIYGIPPIPEVDLVTSRAWVEAGRLTNSVARTKEAFNWPSGRGIWMLDYDPAAGGCVLGRDELMDAIRKACPALAECDMLWYPSASSHIVNTETGKAVTGLRGQRLYTMVEDATDIPRAGDALAAYLWAAGFGRYDVSKSGTLLERTLVDTSVWQTNRIDFAAGAVCVPPLAQQRGAPVLMEGLLSSTCDTAAFVPDPDAATLEKVKEAKAAARLAAEPLAKETRERWKNARKDELAQRLIRQQGLTRELAMQRASGTVDRALERRELFGDWTVHVKGRDGERHDVTVGDLVDNPYTWHGCLTLDPLEPDYDGGRWVGKVLLTPTEN